MLGIVSDEIFEAELNDLRGVDSGVARIIDMKRGRGSVTQVPDVIREIIAEDAIRSDKTQKEVAEDFGVSASSVSAYKNGATSTASYDKPNEQLAEHNNKIRTDIISTARSRLVSALSHITPDKLAEAKLKDVAAVAKDMSVIIKNMEPEIKEKDDRPAPQFIMYAPQFVKEEKFETIYVKD